MADPRPLARRIAGRPARAVVSTHAERTLHAGWSLARTAPGEVPTPEALESRAADWRPAPVPGTVAEADRAQGRLARPEDADDYDAHDWWYRCEFDDDGDAGEAVLRFEGLATLADVWLNGERVGCSANMFRALELDVTARLERRNALHVRFAALRPELARRRPRPRWKTGLVEDQALRWVRTTLLGRMPGWSPPVRPVGPWRPVQLARRRVVALDDGDVLPMVGSAGPALVADLRLRPIGGERVQAATVECAGARHPLAVHAREDGLVLVTGTVPLPDAARWWPHTHGEPALHALALDLDTSDGPVRVALGDVGFRSVTVDREDGAFRLRVNDVPVFCRGACWTPADPVTLDVADADLDAVLGRVRDAGMNMLRVSGVGAYEDERFHARCDRLGLLVWQDLMFARMDYPDDAAWREEALAEVAEVVGARRRHPSLAVWCGNTEVAQQAAMLGLGREAWRPPFFTDAVPRVVRAAGSDAVFVEGSPCGEPLPFTPSNGVAHWFGVGAYRRPLAEARHARVRFAAEALAFANVPEAAALDALREETTPLDARWKARVPRDRGAAWDFDDVRDHYLRALFRTDPDELRARDAPRYLALSRVTTGEAMARTLAEWRRAGSPCAGALVWLLRDPWAGAGWGVLDHRGEPKACWRYLARACAPRAVFLLDEGLDGLWAHVVNDLPLPLESRLALRVLRHGHLVVGAGECDVRVPPHAAVAVAAEDVLGRFADLTQAYRFGPPGHDAVSCTLLGADGGVLASDLYLPEGLPTTTHDVGLAGRVVATAGDGVTVELTAARLAHAVHVEADGWEALDDYLPVVPGLGARVRLRRRRAAAAAVAVARALNGTAAARIDLAPA